MRDFVSTTSVFGKLPNYENTNPLYPCEKVRKIQIHRNNRRPPSNKKGALIFHLGASYYDRRADLFKQLPILGSAY
jgi:hypothetical protein